MKRNAVERGLVIFVVMVFCFGLVACGGNQENTTITTDEPLSTLREEETATNMHPTPTKEPTKKPVEEPEIQEPTHYYYYAAVQGAVILEQDGTRYYVYCKKCEKCGNVQSNLRNTQYGGSLLTSFYCPQCKEVQRVEIEETMKVIW